MNVVAVQMPIAWEDRAANHAAVRSLLDASPPSPGSLVVLPELFATGFSMNVSLTGEAPGGPTRQFLEKLAQHFQVCVVAGVAQRDPDGLVRNMAVAISPCGALLGAYAKMRPFTPGREGNHYAAGEQPLAFEFNGWRVCPFICYDLRFPELFRWAVAQSAPELFLVLANWPAKRQGHWEKLLAARAIENQAWVVGVNRVGDDPHYAYTGGSRILDPQGEVVTAAGDGPGCVKAILNKEELQRFRRGLPFLADLGEPMRRRLAGLPPS